MFGSMEDAMITQILSLTNDHSMDDEMDFFSPYTTGITTTPVFVFTIYSEESITYN